ncbi:GMC family oxidoreductase [Amphritea atlantica]|uniref:GMC family oxidoreductase n=1 Tax=Amphritea atlantica TaxID=355243 RepID=A0ABY5GP57_9GAMM|nr:GMC family oxidoreductase [Amphritea atlantica]
MSTQNNKLNIKTAKDIQDASLIIDADVVVIGSGAGGAINAYELAKQGKKVVVLEAGPYVPSSEFKEMMAVAMGSLYQDEGGQSNTHGDVTVLQGACVGGSTVVNAALCFRTPDYFLNLWKAEHGLVNLTPELMSGYFDKVEKNLSIEPNAKHETSIGANLILNGLNKLAIEPGVAKRNIRDCAMSGFCFSGCKTDRKQSMLVTYLPWACNHGAEIYADTRVIRINTANGQASGVQAEVVDPKTKVVKAQVTVNAPIVVLAAGPIQSPIILQKSGIANSSGQVGKNFACHPSLSVTAMFDKEVNDFHGATHSLYVDTHTLPEEGGYILLNAVQEPVEASFQAEPGTGKNYVAYMEKYRNSIRLITLVHDENVGEVRFKDGVKEILYEVDDHDFEAMKAGLKFNARILFASGASFLYLPTSDRTVINSVDEIDSVIDQLKNEPARYRYTSFHPQGTCRMGADPANSVVNPYGESHDVKKLYISDASLLPTSIGYNPSETVYALSSYIADEIIKANFS